MRRIVNRSQTISLIRDGHAPDIYAKVYQALRKEGTPIPQNDMWIAASALENGADLATCDEHFRHVPMLTVIVVE